MGSGLVKEYGARVMNTCSSPNTDFARVYGCEESDSSRQITVTGAWTNIDVNFIFYSQPIYNWWRIEILSRLL
jgi:hypothetical protein